MSTSSEQKYIRRTSSIQKFGSICASGYQYRCYTYIRNMTHATISVLSSDGAIIDIPTHISTMGMSLNTHEFTVEVVWERSDGSGRDVYMNDFRPMYSAQEYNKLPDTANTFSVTIDEQAIATDVVAVDELGLFITSKTNSEKLLNYRSTEKGYTDRQLEILARKYYCPEIRTVTESELMFVPVAPVVIYANSHSENLQKLYVSVNNIPCEVAICHDRSKEETLILAMKRPDGIVATCHVENFQWSKSNALIVHAFDYDWIIGTNRTDVSRMCYDRAVVDNGKKSESEVNDLVKYKTDTLNREISNLQEKQNEQDKEIKRYKETIKDLSSRLSDAESETKNTVNQKMAYDNLSFNREKLAHEQWKMQMERMRAEWEESYQKIKEANAKLNEEFEERMRRERADRERDKAIFEQEYARLKASIEYSNNLQKSIAEERAQRREEEYKRWKQEEARAKAEAEARRDERSGMYDVIKTGMSVLSIVISLGVLIYKSVK